MVDERVMTRFDRIKIESEAIGETRGEARGRTEGRAEVARNLLKAGVSKDIIAQATGLSITDIER